MLKAALLICRKDLTLSLSRGSGLLQALLLGLLLIFVFSLSLLPGQRMSPTGPWAETPGSTRTPRARAVRRRRRLPHSAPLTRMICRHR